MARGKKKETLTPEERLQATLVPESEQPYPVPGNWCWVKVGTISKVKGGKRLPKGRTFLEEKSDYPYIRVTDFDNESICIENVKYIDSDTHMMIKNYTISSADIYISIAGTIGKVGIIPEELEGANLTENAAKITDINGAYQLYLMLFLKSEVAQNQMKDSTISTTQPKLALFRIEDILLPLPPFSEQQRIVNRIESLFAKLDEAKQKAQDALGGFETRKAAILHKAFTGELTAKWRKEHGVGMETWSSCKLIDILVEKPRNGYSPKPVDYVTACKSMTLSATTTGVFKPEFFKYIDEEIPENSHLWLTPGDILIQRANSLEKVGMSAIYTGAEHEFIYPDLMMKLTVKEPNNKHYIDYYLKTDEILNYFRSNATGTAGNMPKINQKVVSETPLILPETQEQAEIVRLLDDLLAREQQAKEAAEGVLEQIDLIKKAILALAFRGELGTNDPSEESAVELLKQISSC